MSLPNGLSTIFSTYVIKKLSCNHQIAIYDGFELNFFSQYALERKKIDSTVVFHCFYTIETAVLIYI